MTNSDNYLSPRCEVIGVEIQEILASSSDYNGSNPTFEPFSDEEDW